MERQDYDKKLATEQFRNYYIKLNEDKFHLLCAGPTRYEFLLYAIDKAKIWESTNKKLLGLMIARKLNFDVMY